jgi:hypothetical protein
MSETDPNGSFDPGALESSSEHLGVRVWAVNGPTQQALIDRIAVILGEHMDRADELHITYNAMSNGSQAKIRPRLMRPDEQWTALYFEYSAIIVLRPRS